MRGREEKRGEMVKRRKTSPTSNSSRVCLARKTATGRQATNSGEAGRETGEVLGDGDFSVVLTGAMVVLVEAQMCSQVR